LQDQLVQGVLVETSTWQQQWLQSPQELQHVQQQNIIIRRFANRTIASTIGTPSRTTEPSRRYTVEDGDDFYYSSKVAKKSKGKKVFLKSLYQVAPKHHGVVKNRDFVSDKAKINRNPRVKKREQYRKVQDSKKGCHARSQYLVEGQKYAEEQTGVKRGLSRSRKLIS
jgi:hypothetical protein